MENLTAILAQMVTFMMAIVSQFALTIIIDFLILVQEADLDKKLFI